MQTGRGKHGKPIRRIGYVSYGTAARDFGPVGARGV
jgi:hypothetical protein